MKAHLGPEGDTTMKTSAILALTALLAATAGPALADGRGHGHGNARGESYRNCPPGLAKKSVPCVPPGQAKKAYRSGYDDDRYEREDHHRYRVGDRFDRDRYPYERIDNYNRWDLPPVGRNEGYYRDGRVIYRVDEQTRRVLALFRLAEIITGQ
jgi:hypothetical protein